MEFGFGDGHMPLVVKAIVIGAVLVLLWYDFIRYCRKKRKYTVKYRKQQHHKRHGSQWHTACHYVNRAGIVCIVSVTPGDICVTVDADGVITARNTMSMIF